MNNSHIKLVNSPQFYWRSFPTNSRLQSTSLRS